MNYKRKYTMSTTNDQQLYLSVSKTKAFLECKARYKFSYILKLPQKDSTFTIFGKFCHKVLEDFHNAYINGSQEPYNIIMNVAWKAACLEYKKSMTPEMKKECWEIINQYLKIITEDKKNNKEAQVLACEKRFKFPINNGKIILNGAIDRIQIDADNVLHVADYKTIKNPKYLKNNDLQLLTYAYYMLTQEYPQADKVRCSYVLLRHNFKYETYEFTREDVKKAEEYYATYREDILNEKEYPTTVSALCSYCSYLNLCPDGQKKAKIYNGEVEW